MYKCVNDVAGYHCQACNCVKSNKGLQKPLIFKKKKKNKMLTCSSNVANPILVKYLQLGEWVNGVMGLREGNGCKNDFNDRVEL